MDKKKVIPGLIFGCAVIYSIIVKCIDCRIKKELDIIEINKNLDADSRKGS